MVKRKMFQIIICVMRIKNSLSVHFSPSFAADKPLSRKDVAQDLWNCAFQKWNIMRSVNLYCMYSYLILMNVVFQFQFKIKVKKTLFRHWYQIYAAQPIWRVTLPISSMIIAFIFAGFPSIALCISAYWCFFDQVKPDLFALHLDTV